MKIYCLLFSALANKMFLRLLQNLNVKKACGADGIEARFLKAGASAIAASLADLFNVSLSTGKVPNNWKCSRVTPVSSLVTEVTRLIIPQYPYYHPFPSYWNTLFSVN